MRIEQAIRYIRARTTAFLRNSGTDYNGLLGYDLSKTHSANGASAMDFGVMGFRSRLIKEEFSVGEKRQERLDKQINSTLNPLI